VRVYVNRKKRKEKDTIKRNQRDFIAELKEVGVKNIEGELEILDSSASSIDSQRNEIFLTSISNFFSLR